jgi:hypothetical protein
MGREGQFKKGQSGNPGGRPKALKDVPNLSELLLDQALPAVKRLIEISEQRRDLKAALKATEVIIERLWGKVAQVQELKATEELARLFIYSAEKNGPSAVGLGTPGWTTNGSDS